MSIYQFDNFFLCIANFKGLIIEKRYYFSDYESAKNEFSEYLSQLKFDYKNK